MALDKYSKGLEVDEYGNVVTEKYDAQLKPGANPIVPVAVDENATHEALKRVAAENPNLELDDGGHYIEVEQPAPLEGEVAGGSGNTTLRSPVMEQVLEQDAENKRKSAEAAEAQAADSEADGADAQAEAARAAAERAEARTDEAARERAEAKSRDADDNS